MDKHKSITLGELINKLEKFNPKGTINFDFCDFFPTSFEVWRYDQRCLSLGYAEDPNIQILVGGLLEDALSVLSTTIEAHSGGDYQMDSNSLVYVHNYNNNGFSGIFDVRETEYEDHYVIITGQCDHTF